MLISSHTKSCEVLSGTGGPGATGLLFLQERNIIEQETKVSNAMALKMKASFQDWFNFMMHPKKVFVQIIDREIISRL